METNNLKTPKSTIVFFDNLWNQGLDLKAMFNNAFINSNTFESSEIRGCSLEKIKFFYETFYMKFDAQKKFFSELCYQNLNRTMGNLDLLALGVKHNLIEIEIVNKMTKFDSKSNAEYFLQVKDNLHVKTWGFFARYSKLRSFHEKIVNELENPLSKKFFKKPPPFPKKKWFGNKDRDFINKRANDLSQYFSEIVKTKAFLEEGTLKKILYNECKKHIDEEIKTEFFLKNWSKILEAAQSQDAKEVNFSWLKEDINNEFNKFNALLKKIETEAKDIKTCNSLSLMPCLQEN